MNYKNTLALLNAHKLQLTLDARLLHIARVAATLVAA